ncbi:hypothetical protein M408DRAFT_329731 [Serendipita vermifera MAFF 305830]|uniref:Mid2 domain-containing protein n=1 Tax=Serendipita vermifera MAFF 305830 TaxID=933852 RepID=A0A0C3B9M2_SERVB|nr:hypothetical protein M408DRAFT_329731 [Serendipita vermifera MAFF 305830]
MMIFLLWLQLLLLPKVYAFTPTFTFDPPQCGDFTIEWNSTGSTTNAVPPFKMLIVPVNTADAPSDTAAGRGTTGLSLPVQVDIPNTAWDATSGKGKYTFTPFPFRAGERYVVVMDDGNGFGTGGVSNIFIAGGDARGTSCLSPAADLSGIALALSTQQPAQCGALSITTGQASAIRGFVPGGSAFSLDLPAGGTGSMTTVWNVNIATGTSFVLVYIGKDGKLIGTGLMESQDSAGNGSSCLTAIAPHSTIEGNTSAPTTTNTSSSNNNSGGGGSPTINTAAIVGGIVGGLAFIAIIALLTFFCIIRRTDAMGRPKSRSTNSAQGRSTINPYKDFELGGSSVGHPESTGSASGGGGRNRGGGGGAWGRLNSDASTGITAAGGGGAAKAGSGTSPTDGGTAPLEARFGSGMFGRKKKGHGANAPPNQNRNGGLNTFTSSQRRDMYPGLSIASTQNESIGTVSLATHEPMPTNRTPTSGTERTPTSPQPFVSEPAGGIVSRYRDAKRREARGEDNSRGDVRNSLNSDTGTASSVTHAGDLRREGTGQRIRDLGDIDETTGYGSSYASEPSQRRRGNSLGHSESYHDGNEKSSSSDPSSASYQSPTSRRDQQTTSGGRRPSTAPGPGGSTAYHLPTSVGTHETSPQTHDYPPDVKHDEEWEMSDAPTSWRTGGQQHPYAVAQSPHTDSISLPLTSSATNVTSPSVSSGSRHGTSSGRGGGTGRRVRHPYSEASNTEFIRHTDAGPMIDSDDDEAEEEAARRRVVELPPSYGEISGGNRGGRRRGGGG